MNAIETRTDAASHRLLISLTPGERDALTAEARKLGLHLATHIRSIVVMHLRNETARSAGTPRAARKQDTRK